MKKLTICFLALVVLAGCATNPKYLRKNCESADDKGQVCQLNSLCYCEDVPKNNREGKH